MKNMKNISVIRYDSDKNIFLKDEKLTSIEISLDIFLNGELTRILRIMLRRSIFGELLEL